MKTLSPEFVREQSRQNVSDMARLLDRLYDRADTPEAREVLATMRKSIEGIRPMGGVPEVLDVESMLKKVLADYNASFDEDKTAGVDQATVRMIKQIVATRRQMDNCAVDADYKRGFKSYKKAHKGLGDKREIKAAYEREYGEKMEEVASYVNRAKKLDQLVKSYQLRTREARKQQELDELNATVQKLAAQYKKSADQAERDRMNAEYQTLLRKKKSLDAALMGYKESLRNVQTVEALLDQLQAQQETERIEAMPLEDFTALAEAVTAGIKKANARNEKFDEAYGAVASATDKMLSRAGSRNAAGETLDSVILREQDRSLDDIAGAERAISGATLDDIAGAIDG